MIFILRTVFVESFKCFKSSPVMTHVSSRPPPPRDTNIETRNIKHTVNYTQSYTTEYTSSDMLPYLITVYS